MASPFVTGGGGFKFEDEVVAFYLAYMLKPNGTYGLEGSFVLRMLGAQQSKHGWPLDDVLVQAQNPYDDLAHLSIQLKHSLDITVSKSKPEFTDVVKRAWDTFKNTDFGKVQDRFGAAVSTTQQSKFSAIQELCNWAQFSSNADYFAERVSLQGYSNNDKRTIYGQVSKILQGHIGRPPQPADLFRFFKHFTILQFQVGDQARMQTFHARECCRDALVSEEAHRAGDLWNALLTYASNLRVHGGRVDRQSLLEHISLSFRLRNGSVGSGLGPSPAVPPSAMPPTALPAGGASVAPRPSGGGKALVVGEGALPETEAAWNDLLQDLQAEVKRVGHIAVGRKLDALQAHKRWESVSPKVKAGALRLRAWSLIAAQRDAVAIALADEADALDGGTSTFLRASAALRDKGANEALNTLGEAKSLDQHLLKVCFFFEAGQYEEGEKLLAQFEDEAKGEAEWYRLKAIWHAQAGNREMALSVIRQGEAIGDTQIGIKLWGAIIRYQCSRSPALNAGPVASPEPLAPGLFRHDEGSRRLRIEALQNLRELESIEAHPWDVTTRQIWTLACLANDLESMADAQSWLKEVLAREPIEPRAIVWAIQRGLAFDVPDAVTRLRRALAQEAPHIGQLDALLMCLAGQDKLGHARTALNRFEGKFISKDELEVIQSWRWRLATPKERKKLLTQPELSGLGAALSNTNIDELRKVVAAALSEPEQLLIICREIARRELWAALREASDPLIREVHTDDSIRLAAYIRFNNHDFEGVLQIAKDYASEFPGGVLPRDLIALQLNSLLASGNVTGAVQLAEEIAKKTNLPQDMMQWAKLLIKSGNTKKGAPIVREVLNTYPWTDEEAIGFSRALASEDVDLSRSLFEVARNIGISPEFIGAAISLGFRLGLDRQAHEILASSMHDPEVRDKAGLRPANLDDLKDYIFRRRDAASNLSQMYRSGQVPVHMIASRLGLTLSDIWDSAFASDSGHPVLVRHGNRPTEFFVGGEQKPSGLTIDVTAILTADRLGILDVLIGSFKEIVVPEGLAMELQRMADAVRHQQPSHVQQLKIIAAEVREGRIKLYEASDVVKSARQGRVVFSFDEDSTADQSEGDLTLGALCLELVRRGVVTEVMRDRIRTTLSGWQEENSRVEPQTLSSLVFADNTIETLFSADIYDKVRGEFSLFIEKEFLDYCEATVRASDRGEAHSERLRKILGWVIRGQREGWLKTIRVRSGLKRKDFNEEDHDPTVEVMLQSLFGRQVVDRWVWIDDRCLTGYPGCEAGVVVSVFEVLRFLMASGHISEVAYYDHLIELRRRKVLILPLSREEVMHWLSGSRIESGRVQESSELAAVRTYANSILLFEPELDLNPSRSERDKKIESTCLAELNRVSSLCLDLIWSDLSRDEETAIAQSNWVWESLRVERFERLPVINQTEESRRLIWSVIVVQVLLVAFALSANELKSQIDSRRKAMLRWLEGKLVDLTDMGDEGVARDIANHLSDGLIKNFLQPGMRRARRAHAAFQVAVQLFFEELPAAVKSKLKMNSEFSQAVDLKLSEVVDLGTVGEVEEVRFRGDEFWAAVDRASEGVTAELETIKGEKFSVSVESGTSVVVHRESEGYHLADNGFQLLHPEEEYREEFLQKHCLEVSVPGEVFDREALIKSSRPTDRVRRYKEIQAETPGGRYKLLGQAAKPPEARISFERVLPADVGRYLLDLGLSKADLPDWEKVAGNLLRLAGLDATFERLSGFPVVLPMCVKEAFRALDTKDAIRLINQQVARRPTPMRLLKALELIEGLESPCEELITLAQTIYRSIAAHWRSLSDAFEELLAWSQRAWERDKQWRSLPKWMQLSCVWAHADRIAAELLEAHIAASWISQHFRATHGRRTVDLLVWDKEFELDVSAPENVQAASLLAHGLSAAVSDGRTRSVPLPPEVLQLFDLSMEGSLETAPWLVEVRDGATNALGSYLGSCFEQEISAVVEANQLRSGISEPLTREDVVEYLDKHPGEPPAWALLGAVGIPWLKAENLAVVATAAMQLEFPSLDSDKGDWSATYYLAKVIPLLEAGEKAKFEVRLLDYAKRLSEEIRNPARTYYLSRENSPTSALVEFVVALVRSGSAEESVTNLAKLVERIVAVWPASAGLWRQIFSQVMAGMSYSSIELLWRPLLQLRAMK